MVGPKKQDFWPKNNILKGNRCILRIRGAPVGQKVPKSKTIFECQKSTDVFPKINSFKNINLL